MKPGVPPEGLPYPLRGSRGKAGVTVKVELGLTGIKHHTRDRVESHLLVCHVAYLLWVAVLRWLREAKIRLSPEKAMLQLRRVEMVKFRVGEKEKWDCPKAVGE